MPWLHWKSSILLSGVKIHHFAKGSNNEFDLMAFIGAIRKFSVITFDALL